jgi:hypothetical protein
MFGIRIHFHGATQRRLRLRLRLAAAAITALITAGWTLPVSAIEPDDGAVLVVDSNNGQSIGHCQLKVYSVRDGVVRYGVTASARPAKFLALYQNEYVRVLCWVTDGSGAELLSAMGSQSSGDYVYQDREGAYAPPKTHVFEDLWHPDYRLCSFVETAYRTSVYRTQATSCGS